MSDRKSAARVPLVLIVDDDFTTALTLQGLLQGAGLATLLAGSLAEADALFHAQPIALVLLDVHLPDGYGLDLCRKLTAVSPVPILFISGDGDVATKTGGFAAGGVDYITHRIAGIPDEGMNIPLGQSKIKALPAHFMHSEGNFQFYDPVSKILFSGDMGASLVDHSQAAQPVRDFDDHVLTMIGFHRRYMISNKICRFWVNMVRQLDVEMIVPQHGCRFEGKVMVNRFLDWIETLQCGVDLMTQSNYRAP